MKKRPAIALIEKLETQVEKSIQTATAIFQNLSHEELVRKPSPECWSIAQCLEHLNSYGHYYIPEIRKSLEKVKGLPQDAYFKSSWLGHNFTKLMDPTSKMKFKAFKNHIPGTDLDGRKVVAEFIEQQENLLILLNIAKGSNMNSIKLPVSIFKWIKLKIGDVFQFIIAHNERHILQALRNLNQI